MLFTLWMAHRWRKRRRNRTVIPMERLVERRVRHSTASAADIAADVADDAVTRGWITEGEVPEARSKLQAVAHRVIARSR